MTLVEEVSGSAAAQVAGAEKRWAYIIDDEREVRVSLSFLLREYDISGRPFSGAEDFLSELPALTPGCLILDIRMPSQDGISLLTQMVSLGVDWPTIIISGHAELATAVRAMKLGAIEFLEKPFSNEDLLAALQVGFERLAGSQTEIENARKAKMTVNLLTPRERLVLLALMEGLSNKQMAVRFGLSPRTVEMHRTNMLRRSGSSSLSELITVAHVAGLRVPASGASKS